MKRKKKRGGRVTRFLVRTEFTRRNRDTEDVEDGDDDDDDDNSWQGPLSTAAKPNESEMALGSPECGGRTAFGGRRGDEVVAEEKEEDAAKFANATNKDGWCAKLSPREVEKEGTAGYPCPTRDRERVISD